MGWILGGATFGFGLLLLALGDLLRAPARSRHRNIALARGCVCPVAVEGVRGTTREGFLFFRPTCPVHGARARRAVRRAGAAHPTVIAFAVLACLAGLAWLALVLPR